MKHSATRLVKNFEKNIGLRGNISGGGMPLCAPHLENGVGECAWARAVLH